MKREENTKRYGIEYSRRREKSKGGKKRNPGRVI
jgi:hypothetical protein